MKLLTVVTLLVLVSIATTREYIYYCWQGTNDPSVDDGRNAPRRVACPAVDKWGHPGCHHKTWPKSEDDWGQFDEYLEEWGCNSCEWDDPVPESMCIMCYDDYCNYDDGGDDGGDDGDHDEHDDMSGAGQLAISA